MDIYNLIKDTVMSYFLILPQGFNKVYSIDLIEKQFNRIILKINKKTKIKLGRFLTKLFPDLKPHAIAQLSNIIDMKIMGIDTLDEYEFKLYNSDIGEWYKKCSAESCMTEENTNHLPYTYDNMNSNGEHHVSILILYKNGNAYGRALVWENVYGTKNKIFMDRVYPKDEGGIHEMFHKYAQARGWAYRENGTDSGHEQIYNGDKKLQIDLSGVWENIEVMPYMDTFSRSNSDGSELSNIEITSSSDLIYNFRKTSGTKINYGKKTKVIDIPDNFTIPIDRFYNSHTMIEYNGDLISPLMFEYFISDINHPYHWLTKCKYIISNPKGITMDVSTQNTLYLKHITWLDGECKGEVTFIESIWEKGICKCTEFYKSTWKDGVFVDGIFDRSIWENGIFRGGEFQNSIWKNGIWKDGFFAFSNTWEDGRWEKGSWTICVGNKNYSNHIYSVNDWLLNQHMVSEQYYFRFESRWGSSYPFIYLWGRIDILKDIRILLKTYKSEDIFLGNIRVTLDDINKKILQLDN